MAQRVQKIFSVCSICSTMEYCLFMDVEDMRYTGKKKYIFHEALCSFNTGFLQKIQYIVEKGVTIHNMMCYASQVHAFSFPSSISITPKVLPYFMLPGLRMGGFLEKSHTGTCVCPKTTQSAPTAAPFCDMV